MSATADQERHGEARVLAFVPTLNDFDCLSDIVGRLEALRPDLRVLIVDDGSLASFDAARLTPNALYVRLPSNFGLGVATTVAMRHALRHGYRAVVRIDADGQHPVERVPDLLAPIEAGEADLVVGSRTNHHENWQIPARLIKGYFSLAARLMTRGRAPRDVNSGFFAAGDRALELLAKAPLERFPEPELFIRACRAGLDLAEVPVEQDARAHGASSIHALNALTMFFRFNIFLINELTGTSER